MKTTQNMITVAAPCFFIICSAALAQAHDNIAEREVQRLGFPSIGLNFFGDVAPRLAALASATNLPGQSTKSPASLQPSAATHETRSGLQPGLQELSKFRNANETTPRIETVPAASPTRSSF